MTGYGIRRFVFLTPLAQVGDAGLLGLRLITGAFLIHGVWDNIESIERMAEFEHFLRNHGFWRPDLMAPLSCWAQLGCGAAFIAGFLTRWAGLVCLFNFVVALAMVHLEEPWRAQWPALALIGISLVLATWGAGRFSVDAVLEDKRRH